ncbi:nuclease S1 [Talaromyces proteolyticus]|uniref:Nuclease S1 n=1 Tax=Talaromyces proteolyticus TaxID=1131652 RepID=A0AAD4KN58_9EURO|nr:nuclease S1 [Talaromyces proteolyticus]KAH8695274.1 nuclease S1 [Talaromyces proteolyticus]
MSSSFRFVLPATLAIAAQFQGSNAWGDLGHQTIGYIAQNFVNSTTESYCQGILGITNSSYLASVATWADTYKYTSAGEYSKPYHFIDAQDKPPQTCNVDYSRDCGDSGCSISAIKNYTNQLLDSSTSKKESLDALMFIVHFVGDIHQPLHDENLDVGGNTIDVTYNGESTNLHHIWDTNMPEEDAGGYSLSDAKAYASMLTERIKSGQYASNSSSWLDGMDITDPESSSMIWASDANTYVCSTVLEPGLSYIENNDLSGNYYATSQPVFEELIARAGYRLAAWLDLIAANAPSSS